MPKIKRMTIGDQPIEADIVTMKYGSHLFGLDTPDSDVDYKGVFMPKMDELLLGIAPTHFSYTTGPEGEKNSAGDVDWEAISLLKFVKDAMRGETYAIDMLHCENPISTSPIWEDLVSKRTMFYFSSMKSYLGYVKSQASKYGVKGSRLADITAAINSLKQGVFDFVDTLEDGLLNNNEINLMTDVELFSNVTIMQVKEALHFGEFAEWKEIPNEKANGKIDEYYLVNSKLYQSTNTVQYALNGLQSMYDSYGHRAKLAEKNEGIDWKAVSHALRAGYQMRDIYSRGDYVYPLAETAFLRQVKVGELDYNSIVGPALESIVEEVESLAETTSLPAEVNTEFWHQWLLEVFHAEFDI